MLLPADIGWYGPTCTTRQFDCALHSHEKGVAEAEDTLCITGVVPSSFAARRGTTYFFHFLAGHVCAPKENTERPYHGIYSVFVLRYLVPPPPIFIFSCRREMSGMERAMLLARWNPRVVIIVVFVSDGDGYAILQRFVGVHPLSCLLLVDGGQKHLLVVVVGFSRRHSHLVLLHMCWILAFAARRWHGLV